MSTRAILVLAGLVAAVGLLALITNSVGGPDPPSPAESREYVWSVPVEDLHRMAIDLPALGLAQSWVIGSDARWHFDEPDGPAVDTRRWGSGIPLLLSGPAARRPITAEASPEQLIAFGLADPSMLVDLDLVDGDAIAIDVGDPTPDRSAFYIRLRESAAVYTVPESWYRVLERLVVEPPIP